MEWSCVDYLLQTNKTYPNRVIDFGIMDNSLYSSWYIPVIILPIKTRLNVFLPQMLLHWQRFVVVESTL